MSTEQYTDRLLFRASPESERTIHLAGWSGPWPPPPVLFTATGAQTGRVSVFELDEADPEAVSQALASDDITIHCYVRISASEIPERAPADANWFRGAVYVLDRSLDD